jgi:hypothetical protein
MGQAGIERCDMPPKSRRVLPGKRYPLNMRTTKELRDKIEAAATSSGRSLVQEVEVRLEESFLKQNLLALIRDRFEIALTNAEEKIAQKVVQKLKEQGGLPPLSPEEQADADAYWAKFKAKQAERTPVGRVERTHGGRVRVDTTNPEGGGGDTINPRRENNVTNPKRESDNG